METWLAYHEALRRGSAEMFERCIAKGTLEKFEQSAASKKEGLWLAVESLGREMPDEPFPTRNACAGSMIVAKNPLA